FFRKIFRIRRRQQDTSEENKILKKVLVNEILAPFDVAADGIGEFPIRQSRVLSTWQSSFDDGQTCFYNRSRTDEESVLKNKTFSYRFFHSKGQNSADGGFHWFAVQLNEPLLIR
uniref:MATH domain-containing protein n=1 Tax=Macrostomum lignano TaxID=282301 RepID=A0A1I8JJM5_9PLAT